MTTWKMNVSEVASSGSGTIHGIIVGQVSPVKASKKQPGVKYSSISKGRQALVWKPSMIDWLINLNSAIEISHSSMEEWDNTTHIHTRHYKTNVNTKYNHLARELKSLHKESLTCVWLWLQQIGQVLSAKCRSDPYHICRGISFT